MNVYQDDLGVISQTPFNFIETGFLAGLEPTKVVYIVQPTRLEDSPVSTFPVARL